jgi:hypothetical protein
MKVLFVVFLLAVSASATAQSADAIYSQACGPKQSSFTVEQVKGQPPAAPEPGKALIYFIQKESAPIFITRVGLDGSWTGVLLHDSWVSASVAPGEHHACVATQDRKHPGPELVHFTAEAGKTYYFLVRGIVAGADYGGSATMLFGAIDRDEALFLLDPDLKSVATPKQ